jgi:hypothetical protein
MKRKTLLKLTACGLVGALTIGNFTVAAYAAPTAGVASLASDIATTSSAPTAGFSLALSEVAEKVEDEATVASAQPEVKEGSVIELTVTPPDGEPLKANIKVQAEDMALLQMIKNMQQK